jgi:hypothetical protein
MASTRAICSILDRPPRAGLRNGDRSCRKRRLADALSTALFVMGPADALRFARRHPEIDVVVIETTRWIARARDARLALGMTALVPGIVPEIESR